MKYSPYSFSKISTYNDCQKRFEFTYVNKVPVDSNYIDPSYFKRGRFLHAYIAERLNGGDGMKMKDYDVGVEDKLKLVESAETALKNELILLSFSFDVTNVESYISLDSKLDVVAGKSKTAIGGYIDYVAVHDNYAIIVDWKSGRYNETPNYSQLELYSIWLINKFPDVTKMDLVFYYVEHDVLSLKTITNNEVVDFKSDLVNEIIKIENTDTFHTNVSARCNSCKFINTCMALYGITV